MTFYTTGRRGTLQEILDAEQRRAAGESSETCAVEELASAADIGGNQRLIGAGRKPKLSTFEVELMDAWSRP